MTPEAGVAPRFEERAARQLRDRRLPLIIGKATDTREARRREAFAELDLEGLRASSEAVREHTLANLDSYLSLFAERAESRGMQVFFAGDAAEANGRVRQILRERGARVVAKSKSMVAEEIGLNRALEEDGVRVVETDLGEYIVQLAGEPPSHIIAPAVHKTRGEVAELFQSKHNVTLPGEPEALTAFARQALRETFLSADVGISGVNFAVAESGSLALVTNEGNGRMVTSLPPVHVAIMGMERVVPSFRELGLLLPMLVASATGRSTTSYLSFVNGPRLRGEPDGPDEVHVIVVDNGRSRILGTEFQSVLNCIRCGACQNVCPVYRQVGGHGYGSVYGGPIGAVLTPLLAGLEVAGDLSHASSLCGACTEVCPVKIPLHEHLISLRRELARQRGRSAEAAIFRGWSALWSRPAGYRISARLARAGQSLLLRRPAIRRPLPLLSRWWKNRELPAVAGETFRERWDRLAGRPGA